LAIGTVLAVSLVAAACGGGSSAAKAPAKTTATTAARTASSAPGTTAAAPGTTAAATGRTATSGAGAGGPGGATAFAPAASGTIASILGQDLEVQGTSGQTTVELTAKTVITASVALKLRDITPGTCISATGTKGTGGKVDATVVTVSAAVNGKCLERAGFGRGAGGGGGGGGFPTRTGTVPARFRVPTNVAGAFGKVTAVSGSTITVQGLSFAFGAGGGSGAPAPRATTTPKTSTQVVVVSSKTTYSKSERVKAGALKVGECATAIGSTNDIGVVTATRLSVTQPIGGSCTTGFGFRGGFGGGAGAGGSGGFAPGGFSAGSGQGAGAGSAGATS
jgi:hypothetical protein